MDIIYINGQPISALVSALAFKLRGVPGFDSRSDLDFKHKPILNFYIFLFNSKVV